MFNNKSILITGGTGSFGQKCTAVILERYEPRRLIIFSRDELKQSEVMAKFDRDCIRFNLGDIRDIDRLKQIMRDVDIVIHAAALKRVEAGEYNPSEFVRTNVLGTMNVAQACVDCEVDKAIFLSSDKACAAVNLYGMTKACGERIWTAAQNMVGPRRTKFAVVRYGNVAGSRGSIVPLFKQLVAEGASVLPITDARMTRFWFTLQNGIDFVLKNFERMQGGEIFIPRLPSARIIDIATAIGPGLSYNIVGMRPGEKIHEILCPAETGDQTLIFPDHFVITPSISFAKKVEYTPNPLGETGIPAREVMDNYLANMHAHGFGVAFQHGWEYGSGTNADFLTVEQIRTLLDEGC